MPVAQLRGHGDGPIHIVRFTTDGKYCLTGGNDRTARLWNPTRIDPAYRPPPPSNNASADNTHGAFVSSQEYYGRPKMSEHLPSALPMQTYADGHLHPVHCVAANATSTVLLSASDKTILATDLVTAQAKQKWWGHAGRIECVACLGGNPDGSNSTSGVGEEVYASASYDATVRLWDARSRSKEPLMILEEAKDAVTCVASGRGGEAQIVTSSVDGRMRTYDLRMAQLLAEDIGHPITSFSLASDGASVAASCLDGIVRLWDRCSPAGQLNSRKRVFRKLHSSHKSENYKVECSFSSDDRYVVSGSECGAVVVYPVDLDLDRGSRSDTSAASAPEATVLRRHKGPTCSVAACPQRARPWLTVSASYDGSAVVWASAEQHDCCTYDR